jgi:hypothetical protein
MAKILVGTYASRRDADEARAQLVERGFDDSQISVEGENAGPQPANPAATQARGFRGVVARMFGDLFPEKADHERYERAVRTGGALVAVHGLSDSDAVRAKAVLEQKGSVDEHAHESLSGVEGDEAAIERSAGFSPQTERAAARAQAWHPRSPDETPLPNAPTGWDEAVDGERSTIGSRPNDPARPEGATRGANDVGATLDRERIERKP